jgi:aminopeptidase YwaD
MTNDTYTNLIQSVRREEMEQLLVAFSQWHRLTGTPDSEKAADYLVQQLEAAGIAWERHQLDAYFSDPVRSELLVGNLAIASKPRSGCAHCPEGVIGEVVFDPTSKGPRLTGNEERELYSRFRGKIVLSWNFYEDYVKKLEAYGAIGLIHVWQSGETALHEETVGPVWGTPTLENISDFPRLPVVGINRDQGSRLIERTGTETLHATLRTWVDYRLAKVSLPVAWIPGKTSEYVLVSGHYDSWHEGVTDNATGNAACLELARVVAALPEPMERGVKIAWWPGHSNGRYMGSTWYCDHFWQDLHDHCVGHLNIDSPGSQGGMVVLPRTTRLEGTGFTADLLKAFLGAEPASFLDIPRGADQSFWGTDIPFHIMYKYEPVPERKIYQSPGSGGGWWWHSEFDSLDKVDYDLLLRDTRLLAATLFRLASCQRLPSDFPGYFSRMVGIFRELDAQSDPAFNFERLLAAAQALGDKVQRVMAGLSDSGANQVIKRVGGRLNRLMYSSCDPFHFDNTFAVKPFPGLQVAGVHRATTPPEQFLFTLTGFIRQTNRFLGELHLADLDLEQLSRKATPK